MEFKPPVTERETDELIAIANCTTDDWQKEIIEQSRKELSKRGISAEMQEAWDIHTPNLKMRIF